MILSPLGITSATYTATLHSTVYFLGSATVWRRWQNQLAHRLRLSPDLRCPSPVMDGLGCLQGILELFLRVSFPGWYYY